MPQSFWIQLTITTILLATPHKCLPTHPSHKSANVHWKSPRQSPDVVLLDLESQLWKKGQFKSAYNLDQHRTPADKKELPAILDFLTEKKKSRKKMSNNVHYLLKLKNPPNLVQGRPDLKMLEKYSIKKGPSFYIKDLKDLGREPTYTRKPPTKLQRVVEAIEKLKRDILFDESLPAPKKDYILTEMFGKHTRKAQAICKTTRRGGNETTVCVKYPWGPGGTINYEYPAGGYPYYYYYYPAYYYPYYYPYYYWG